MGGALDQYRLCAVHAVQLYCKGDRQHDTAIWVVYYKYITHYTYIINCICDTYTVGVSLSSSVGSATVDASTASSSEPKPLERNHVIVDQGEICCNGQWWVCTVWCQWVLLYFGHFVHWWCACVVCLCAGVLCRVLTVSRCCCTQ